MTRRIFVDRGGGVGTTQRLNEEAPPRPVWKQRGIRNSGAEVEHRGMSEDSGQRDRLPDAPRLEQALHLATPCVAAQAHGMFADERACPDTRDSEAFAGQALVRNRHG